MDPTAVITLLFVDDDTSYMAVAQHLLSKYQGRRFNILWRQDGLSAIELLQKTPDVDMLLLDYYLPELNGLEVARVIRENQIDVPIIFLTSNKDFRLAVEAMKYGVEDYLVKDEATDSVLPRTIVNILDRVRLKRAVAHQRKADLVARKRTDAIKELVVTVCHEFNNPLAAIKISTDILQRHPFSTEDKGLVHDLDVNIERIEKHINRLRDINFDQGGP